MLIPAITHVTLYPFFAKPEEWVKQSSLKIVKKGKSMGGKYLELILTFIAGIIILSYFYARLWYNIDYRQSLRLFHI